MITTESEITPDSEGATETVDPAETVDTAEAVTATDSATAEESAPPARNAPVLRRFLGYLRAAWGTVALTLLTVATVVTAAALFAAEYLPDSHLGDADSQAVLNAAKDDTVSLLSYSPDTLDKDFAAAKSHLTGDFLTYYSQFTDQVIMPAAKQKAVKTSAVVVRGAVSDLSANSATVLVFINQTTTSTDKPDPAVTSSSVRVSMTKVGSSWKISAFDPV